MHPPIAAVELYIQLLETMCHVGHKILASSGASWSAPDEAGTAALQLVRATATSVVHVVAPPCSAGRTVRGGAATINPSTTTLNSHTKTTVR